MASPTQTTASSIATRTQSREMLGRPMRAATTESIISLAIHRTASGVAARNSRRRTMAFAYPRCVSHTSRRNGGRDRSARNFSRHVDQLPLERAADSFGNVETEGGKVFVL